MLRGFFREIFPAFLVFVPKFLGRTDFDRNIFGFSRFRANIFFIFQLSTGNFLGFLNFEPEKNPKNSRSYPLQLRPVYDVDVS